MIEYELPLDEEKGESFPAMNFDFPYIWFWGEVDKYVGGHVPWHWHEEPEFCHILKGEIEYRLPDRCIVLKAGDGIFINSNVLHMICPHNGCKGAVMIPQVFHKLLLTGYHRSAIDLKYYRPIVDSEDLPCYVMRQDTAEGADLLQLMDECYQTAEAEDFGYELAVRSCLSRIWLKLYLALKDQLQTGLHEPDRNSLRLKQILQYISEHFGERITLEDMASAASISERECTRCFRKYMNTAPFKYLQEYRVDAAANLLLHTDQSVTEIAVNCGFGTSSYFSKVFRQYMKCSPRDYRNTSGQTVSQPHGQA